MTVAEVLKIAVSKGHNVYNKKIFDNGASGYGKKEAIEVDKTVDILIQLLRNQGHTVVDVTPKNEHFNHSKQAHQERARRVNSGNFDIYLDIHLNAGGGTGSEMWVYSPRGLSYDYARKMVNSIVADTGLANRGVKVKPTMWSLAMTNCPSIIIEGGFMDSKRDMDVITPELYAKSIARAFGGISKDNSDNTSTKKNDSMTYIRLIKAGTRGDDVKQFQLHLNKLGFNCGKADGIAGNSTEKAITLFQKAHGLVADGLAGRSTIAKLNEVLKSGEKITNNESNTNSRKSKYCEIGNACIIETTPDNIQVEVLGDTLHGANKYGINGALFDTQTAPVGSPESCVFIAMNNGMAISNNSQFNGYKSPARATLIYHTNGLLGFRQLTNINPIRNTTQWAIGGYMVKPYMDFKNEQIPSSVNYKTAHSYVGYDKDGKIYLIAKPNHMISEIVPLLNQLKITNCIVLDGGGSSQLNHPDGNYRNSRKINTALTLKEI